MAHLKMPPLVPIGELDGHALLQRCSNERSLLFAEALTGPFGDDEAAV